MDVNPYESPSGAEPLAVAAPLGLAWRVLRFCLLALLGGGSYAVAAYLSNSQLWRSTDPEAFWMPLSVCALAVGGSEFLYAYRHNATMASRRIVLSVLAMIVAAMLGGLVSRAFGLHYRMYSGPPYGLLRYGILLVIFAIAIGVLRLGIRRLGRPIDRDRTTIS